MPIFTFLFTDFKGSSELKIHGHFGADETTRNARYQETVNRPQLRRLRELVETHAGRYVKGIGDSVFAAFLSPTDAFRAAVAMQRSFTANPIQTVPGSVLSIRIGLHTGEAIEQTDDFHGSAVDVAARVESAADGEQILISGSTHGLLGRIDDMPFHRL